MGEGSPEPRPTFCVVVDGAVVGWVDADHEEGHHWLAPHEANLGYAQHPDHRGRGYVTRAMHLLVSHLRNTPWTVATLAIDHDNAASLAVAARCGFDDHGTVRADKPSRLFKRLRPPIVYTDGVVTIRPPRIDDAEAHTAATDDVQIDWLWEPGQRESWEAMSPTEQLDHQRRFLARTADEWGSGPRWWFVIEHDGRYAGHVDADLANPHVAHGEANISYSMRPDLRGRGLTSRAVRLVLRFVADHTGAREAHFVVDPANEASQRVLRAVGGPVITITR